jgi:uncharacterized membrane protein
MVAYGANHHWLGETTLAGLTIGVAAFVAILAWLSVYLRNQYAATLSLGVGVLLIVLLFLNFAFGLVDSESIARTLNGDLGVWGWLVVNPRGLAMFSSLFAAGATAAAIVRSDNWPMGSAAALQRVGLFALLNGLAFVTVELVSHGELHRWGTGRSLAVTCAWSLYATGCLIGGIQARSAQLRVFALVLFLGTTVKVFLHDVWYLHAVIRYVAFTVLGIALLSASFLYRRFQDRLRDWVAGAEVDAAVEG